MREKNIEEALITSAKLITTTTLQLFIYLFFRFAIIFLPCFSLSVCSTPYMRFIITRVSHGAVKVGEEVVGSIDKGISVLVGISRDDTMEDMESLAKKLLSAKLWPDENNNSWKKTIKDIEGGILLISQFTLYHIMKGTKPDFHHAMKAEDANVLFLALRDKLRAEYSQEKVQTGKFQSYMMIPQELDGPVTLIWDSKVKN